MFVFQIVPPLAAGICYLNHRQAEPAPQVDQVTLIGTAIICAIGAAITIATCPNNILQGLVATFIPSFVYRAPLALYNFLKPVLIKHGEQNISTFSSLPTPVTRIFSSIIKIFGLIKNSFLTGLKKASSFLSHFSPRIYFSSKERDGLFLMAVLVAIVGSIVAFFYSLVTTPVLLLEIIMVATLLGTIWAYNLVAPQSIKPVINHLLIFEALCMAIALPAVATEELLYDIIGLFITIYLTNVVYYQTVENQPPPPL